MSKIVQKEDPVLRKIAKEIPIEDIGKDKLNKIIAEMALTLDKCEDGVALAAPQIGVSLRVFVVSPKAFSLGRDEDLEVVDKKEANKLVYINPTIIRKSAKKITLDEGCLSVRNIFGKIKRHEKVTISAYDELGNKFSRGATGLLAEIFQHETDHLNGILFIDSAKDLIEVESKDAKDAK
jgi:peptide deformylase